VKQKLNSGRNILVPCCWHQCLESMWSCWQCCKVDTSNLELRTLKLWQFEVSFSSLKSLNNHLSPLINWCWLRQTQLPKHTRHPLSCAVTYLALRALLHLLQLREPSHRVVTVPNVTIYVLKLKHYCMDKYDKCLSHLQRHQTCRLCLMTSKTQQTNLLCLDV